MGNEPVDLNDEFNTTTKAEEGVEIELVSIKTGRGAGVFIKVHGMDSRAFDGAKADRARIVAEKVEAGNEITPQDRAETQAAMLAACTISWRNLRLDGVVDPPCTHETAMKLYLRFPAIREQINVAIGTRANFVGA